MDAIAFLCDIHIASQVDNKFLNTLDSSHLNTGLTVLAILRHSCSESHDQETHD